MRAWVLTDGDADLETRCLGVAEAVAERIERRRIMPRAPWRWLAPFGPIDPRDAPEASAIGPISPRDGWPDVAIASGRSAAPYLMRVRRASQARVITVFIGESAAGSRVADIVAARSGSRLLAPNVMVAPTRPHRVGPIRLAAARGGPPIVSSETPGPKVAVMLGGPRRRQWSAEDVARLAAGLAKLRADGAVIAVASRREAAPDLDMALGEVAHYLWDRTGPDPAVALLAQADALVVAGDDVLSIDEAAATGRPLMAFRPSRTPASASAHLDRLTALGVVRPFAGRLEAYAYRPLDSTGEIARAISALAATRAALSPRLERRAGAPAKTETNGPTSR